MTYFDADDELESLRRQLAEARKANEALAEDLEAERCRREAAEAKLRRPKKLTLAQVAEIGVAKSSIRDLAERFGVSHTAVWKARRRAAQR